MINRIKNELKKINHLLFLIQEKVSSCSLCKNGVIEIRKRIFNIDITFNTQCKCQFISGVSKIDLEEKRSYYKNCLNKIKIYVPKDYQENVFFENQIDEVKDFIKNKKVFLWIYGPNGTGKTSAINAVKIKQIIDNSINILNSVNELNFSYMTNIKDFIAIDDVYKLKSQERLRYLLPCYYGLINYKRENREKVIFTSNYSLEDFLRNIARIDSDIASAIQDRMQGLTVEVLLDGQSLRKKQFIC